MKVNKLRLDIQNSALEVYVQDNSASSDLSHLKEHPLMAIWYYKHFCRRFSQESGSKHKVEFFALPLYYATRAGRSGRVLLLAGRAGWTSLLWQQSQREIIILYFNTKISPDTSPKFCNSCRKMMSQESYIILLLRPSPPPRRIQ